MTNDPDTRQLLLTRVKRLDVLLHGLAGGLLGGSILCAATLWLLIKGGDPIGPHLALLGQFFIGYRVSWLGSLMGFGYGFAVGFAVVASIGGLYNLLTRRLDAPSGDSASTPSRAPEHASRRRASQ